MLLKLPPFREFLVGRGSLLAFCVYFCLDTPQARDALDLVLPAKAAQRGSTVATSETRPTALCLKSVGAAGRQSFAATKNVAMSNGSRRGNAR